MREIWIFFLPMLLLWLLLLLMVEPTSPTPPAPPPTLLFRLSDTSKMWCHSLRVKFPLFFGVGGFCFFGFLRVQFFFLGLSSSSRRPIQWRSTTQKIKHGGGVINEWISPPDLGLRCLLRSWWWMLEDDNKTISRALVTAKMPRQLLELDSFVSKVSAIVSLIFKSPSRAEGSESKQLEKKGPPFFAP